MRSTTEFSRVELPGGSCDLFRTRHFHPETRPHLHETYSLGVLESGLASVRTPRGEFMAKRGSIFAFAPGEVHSVRSECTDGFASLMFYPVPTALTGSFTPEGWRYGLFRQPVLDDPETATALLRANEELGGNARSDRAAGAFQRALAMMATRHALIDRSASDSLVRRHVEYVKDAFREDPARPVRLETLAKARGITRFHLIRIFRSSIGLSPYAYLIQLRVCRAQEMLRHGASVATAAYACGFSDQSHLTRAFGLTVGVPPGQYRRAVRQGEILRQPEEGEYSQVSPRSRSVAGSPPPNNTVT